jgi:hypothetical protein
VNFTWQIFCHLLNPSHGSLVNGDGSLRKTNTEALAQEFEQSIDPPEDIPGPSMKVIDGMKIVQEMNGNDTTFALFADAAIATVKE